MLGALTVGLPPARRHTVQYMARVSQFLLRWAGRSIVAAGLLVACDMPSQVEPSPGVFRAEACGNGVVEADEACDLGFANAPDGPCRDTCRWPSCGDGVQDEGEQCDDGNDADDDACRSDCTRPLRSRWVRAPVGGQHPEQVDAIAIVDGGVVVAGQAQRAIGDPARAWLARYDDDGELRWQRWLPDDPQWREAAAADLVVDDDGDLWVVGHVAGEGEDDLWIARCNPEGEPRWEVVDDLGGSRDRALAVTRYGDGVAVAGEVLRAPDDRDGFALGLDADGERTLFWRHDGPAGRIDDARAIAATADGGLVLGGGEDGLSGWWLAKVDAEGLAVGYSRGRGAVGAWISALRVDADGEIWATGTEVIDAEDPADPASWSTQPFVARFDPAGRQRWWTTDPPDTSRRREAEGLALAPDGGVTIVGTDPLPSATCTRRYCPSRLWVAHYDRAGARRYWFSPALVRRGEGRAIAWDPSGTLWLGGSRRVVLLGVDAWIGRYAPEASP